MALNQHLNINFEINGPKIVGLLGRNGAGKTSLLTLIASLSQITKGELTINGQNPFENDEIMPQVSLSNADYYVKEGKNITKLFSEINKYRSNFDLKYANYLVELFDLYERHPIRTFSNGMKAAVSAIIGLASRTPITIFDEIHLGMDAPTRDLFYKELLKDYERVPRTIILSTHLISEMEFLFDEIILLKDGETLLQGEMNEVLEKGISLTGHKALIDSLVQTKNVLHTENLGDTTSVILYDTFSDDELKIASSKGIQIANISLNDLVIHLTKEVVYYEPETEYI